MIPLASTSVSIIIFLPLLYLVVSSADNTRLHILNASLRFAAHVP
jgi:hypothetical protein